MEGPLHQPRASCASVSSSSPESPGSGRVPCRCRWCRLTTPSFPNRRVPPAISPSRRWPRHQARLAAQAVGTPPRSRPCPSRQT